MQNLSQIVSFSSFGFSTILSHVRNNNPKILLFCLKAIIKTLNMVMIPVNNETYAVKIWSA